VNLLVLQSLLFSVRRSFGTIDGSNDGNDSNGGSVCTVPKVAQLGVAVLAKICFAEILMSPLQILHRHADRLPSFLDPSQTFHHPPTVRKQRPRLLQAQSLGLWVYTPDAKPASYT
jgi:hypothetical protein